MPVVPFNPAFREEMARDDATKYSLKHEEMMMEERLAQPQALDEQWERHLGERMRRAGLSQTDIAIAAGIMVEKAQYIPKAKDMPKEWLEGPPEKVVPWTHFGAKKPEDFLKTLPKDYDAFEFSNHEGNPTYMIIKRKPADPKDLVS